MEMYEKLGYLNNEFKIFHLNDKELKTFNYHYHDFNKILIFLKGNVSYLVEGKAYPLKPYDIVLVNSGEIHKPIVHDASGYERIIIYVSNEFLNLYKEDSYDLSYCFKKAQQEHLNVLRVESLESSKLYHVSKELESSFLDKAYANELYSKLLFLEFMIHLNRASITEHISYVETTSSNKRLLTILEYINEHITEDLSIDRLANEMFMDKYYLMHLFKHETSYTIGTYITNKRLQMANEKIKHGTPITTACYECGFRNYSTFSRAYKKYYNASPRAIN